MSKSIKKIITNTYHNAVKSIVFMLKIIIPVTFIVMLLKYLDLIKYITFIFEPFMKIFGLRGEAALVIISGNLINNYGAIAAISTLNFTVKEITIIAVMLLFSHSLLVECAIMKGIKISISRQLLIRITSALISGIILNILIGNNYNQVINSSIKSKTQIPSINDSFSHWLTSFFKDYFNTILDTTISIIIIITGLLLFLEILKTLNLFNKINNLFYKITRYLGFSKYAQTSLLVGIFIGITYGASTILIDYNEGKMNKKDLILVSTFLLLCHALIEDVVLFVNIGAIAWIIIVYKILFTILVIYILNIFLNIREKTVVN